MTLFSRVYLDFKVWITRRTGLYIYRHGTPLGLSLQNDLAQLVPRFSPNTIIDVGANVGQTALHFSDLWPTAHIYSFEPVSATFRELVSTTAHRRSAIHPECIALSDSIGKTKIFLSDNSQLASLEHTPLSDGFRTGRAEDVELQTLDNWCQMHNVNSIDLFKIDAEGHDFAVLRGAQDLFSESAIKAVLVEVHFSAPSVDSFPQLLTWLKARQFQPVAFYDQAVAVTAGLFYGNILFIHRSLLLLPESYIHEQSGV